jgi:hypothetical protein
MNGKSRSLPNPQRVGEGVSPMGKERLKFSRELRAEGGIL